MAVKKIAVRSIRKPAVKKSTVKKIKAEIPTLPVQVFSAQKIDYKAWVVGVNMGYGHQRTAFPLRFLAPDGEIINANNYPGIPEGDKLIWESTRNVYEFISRLKSAPVIGEACFSILERFQKILSYYPKRDHSESNFSVEQVYSLLKRGWGSHLIGKLGKRSPGLPFITTFFNAAFMAEFFGYPGDIFCVICDADIARAWAPLNPHITRIKYFAPNQRVAQRLESYGINRSNIIFTGFPLPLENIGDEKMEILKEDLRYRLLNLDPQGRYRERYHSLVERHLGRLPLQSSHPLTIMFSMGGAGAQKEIGVEILKNLKDKIILGSAKVILSAGSRESTKNYFEKEIKRIGLSNELKGNIEILFEKKIEDYFLKFNAALRKTDILWTKPSELSFYSALGIPIIVSPPIGSQEDFNQRWILKSGFGINQEDPRYLSQWLFDWLDQGYLAEAAMQAFVEGEQLGVLKIKEEIKKCFG
ncbi:MAG: hypothetical protein WCX77_00310 [Candidatus Paceibacterota bacterium]|jgi:hypothetical protein